MYDSIGKAAHVTGIVVSALRYYDREDMFLNMKQSNGGTRVSSNKEINTIRVIECLKASGMSIRTIKEFLIWRQEGDSSLHKRQEMLHI